MTKKKKIPLINPCNYFEGKKKVKTATPKQTIAEYRKIMKKLPDGYEKDWYKDAIMKLRIKTKKNPYLRTEQIIQQAEDKANTDLGERKIINKLFRKIDDSHLWPISGKFNVTDRAIRRVNKFEKSYGVLSPAEYAYMIRDEIEKIVNTQVNPQSKKGVSSMATRTKKRRKITRRKARRTYKKRNPQPTKGKLTRPWLYKKRSGYYRGKRSSLPKKMQLRNPSRKRRRNPARRGKFISTIQKTFSRDRLMSVASITGGITTGFLVKPVIVNIMPENIRDTEWFRKFVLGLIHIAAGGLVVGYTKNKNSRMFGMAVMSTGAYDILQQNFPELGLPAIPDANIITEQMLGTSYEFGKRSTLGASYQVPKRPTSPVSEPGLLGANYEDVTTQPAGLSGGSNPYEGIDW